MAEETQAQQAAETQPETQPQPEAQAAPAEQPNLVKMTLSTGQEVWYGPDGKAVDAEGKPLTEDPWGRGMDEPAAETAPAVEQPVEPEAQADGTPEAKPAEEDPLAKAKAELEAAQKNLALQQFLAAQPGNTYMPGEPELPQVEFGEIDTSDMPDFTNKKFASDAEAKAAVEAWAKTAAERAAKAHSLKLMQAHHEERRKQAVAAQQDAQNRAMEQRLLTTHREAMRRSGLSEADYNQKLVEVAQAARPAWWTGGDDAALPFNYVAGMLDESIRTNHEMRLPTEGFDSSADWTAEAVRDPEMVRTFTNALPRTPEAQAVLTALTEGPHAVARLKALTGTEDGKKALAWMMSIPAAGIKFQSPRWYRYSEHVRNAASRFDKPANAPAAQPAASPANVPAEQPAAEPVVVLDSPYRTPEQTAPAVTPEMSGSAAAPSTNEPDLFDDPVAWERRAIEKMRKKAQRDAGYIPAYLQ